MEMDRKRITEENLIRCGREEFLEKGYTKANLRDICRKAGVTTGAFYFSFENKEALRVVKKGGVFSFQDMFSQKALYGDMEEFVEELKKEGITEVHYIGNLEKKLDFIPGYATTPWMISGMGILYGRK